MRTWEELLFNLTLEDVLLGKKLGIAFEINDGIIVSVVPAES